MGTPYVGEIRMFGGNFAPAGWAFCNGALMPISENETLFQLIGTTYGGDGQSTFALPDLQGRIPLHQGNGFVMGQSGGVEQVTLTVSQIPSHNHSFLASTSLAGLSPNPGNNVAAGSTTIDAYINDSPDQQLTPQSISPVGGSQPHDNMMPFLAISFIISLFGVYPSPN